MRSRSHFTGVWLNDAEYRQLMQLCQSSGLSASAMIRKCILGATVKPRPPDCYAELLRVLSGIGTNINQIARKLHTDGEIPNDSMLYFLNKNVLKYRKESERIWRLIRRLISGQIHMEQ